MRKQVIVTGKAEPVLMDGLKELGFGIVEKLSYPEDQLIKEIDRYAGIVISSQTTLDRDMLEAGKNLEFIARLGSGLEIIDVNAAKEMGIAVFNSPEGNRHAVAEHALGSLLSLVNHINISDREVRQGKWLREENRGRELRFMTVGIIGFGNTGRRFAEVLSGFDVRILAFDKYLTNYADDLPYVSEVKLEDIQREADVVSLHVPLTPDTHHLINMQFLQGCNDGLILVNTSRGAVVSTGVLVDALESGKIGGACLDVFENEPPHVSADPAAGWYEKLFRMDNVILTPHIAGWTKSSKDLLSSILLEKIQAFYQGN